MNPERFNQKTATIGILGLGYVGLPLVLRYSDVGYKVVGFDVDGKKISALNKGESYIEHISGRRIQKAIECGFRATDDFSEAVTCDALILCVPTPLSKHREPDLSYVTQTMVQILPHLQAGQVVSLESTTWPGTTDEVLKPMIEGEGFIVGKDIFLVYSPEREDPGNPSFETRTIPKVVGGVTPECLEMGKALYEHVIDALVPVSSTRAAEMTKLLENIHRAVNIGLVNELKIVCDKMNVDIHEVINAAKTKPFGFTAFYPGPGLGGHCIPIDPFYLTWKAREYGLNTHFIELAGEVNTRMPEWVIAKVQEALNNCGKAVKGANILVLGVAYKKNVDDMRESPAIELIKLLMDKGANVTYSDPHVPELPQSRLHDLKMQSVTLDEKVLKQSDCVLIATNHDKFDYDFIQTHARLVVDTRGVYQGEHENVVKA